MENSKTLACPTALSILEGIPRAAHLHSQPLVMPGTRAERVAASIIMGIGIGLRVTQYAANRSLWGDEAAIALNLRLHGFGQLFHPLSYEQTMPLGLLVLLKGLVTISGFSEWSLRLLLLLAGCALVVLTWFLFSPILEQRVVFLMLALVSISQPLIDYSAEVKQYGLDALVAVIMVWLGITNLTAPSKRTWLRLILGGAVAMMFSQTAVFVLASVGIATAFDSRFRSSRSWRKYVFVATLAWSFLFAMLYCFSYRAIARSPFMRAFWSPRFIHPGTPGFRKELANATALLLGHSQLEFQLHLPALALGCLFLIGLYVIRQKRGTTLAIIAAGPFALVLLACVLQQYPIVLRLILFSFPILFWVYASAVSGIAGLLPTSYKNSSFIALSSLFILPIVWDVSRVAFHATAREGTRDIVHAIEAPNLMAPVYIVFGRYSQWGYYAGDWTHPELVQQRIASAFASSPKNCPKLDFLPADGKPEEIVGCPPPLPERGPDAEEGWATEEAIRISAIRSKWVWLFLPDLADHFITGYPMRRKLLQKLESHLDGAGCRWLETVSEGESRADRYSCPSGGVRPSIVN